MARELNQPRNPYNPAHSPDDLPSSVRQRRLAQTAMLQHEGPLQPIEQPEQAEGGPEDDEHKAKDRKGAAQAARDAERLAVHARLEELEMEEAYGNDSDDFEKEDTETENEEEKEEAPEDRPPRPPPVRPRRDLNAGANELLEGLAKHLSFPSSSTNKSFFDAEMVKILKLKGKLDPEEKETFLDDFAMQISLADEEAGWLLQLPVDEGADAWLMNCHNHGYSGTDRRIAISLLTCLDSSSNRVAALREMLRQNPYIAVSGRLIMECIRHGTGPQSYHQDERQKEKFEARSFFSSGKDDSEHEMEAGKLVRAINAMPTGYFSHPQAVYHLVISKIPDQLRDTVWAQGLKTALQLHEKRGHPLPWTWDELAYTIAGFLCDEAPAQRSVHAGYDGRDGKKGDDKRGGPRKEGNGKHACCGLP